MTILHFVVLVFICVELANVLTLYFDPGSKKFNGVGVFNAWEKTKKDPEIHNFVRYLVYWVAGTKLIFIFLLGVILLYTDETILRITILSLIISISPFFWRLYPLIRRMDYFSQISPDGYSKILGYIIATFVIVFLVVSTL